MKYIVIGGGVSGLTVANLLQRKGHVVTVMEAEASPGGLVRCEKRKEGLFHLCGGHVFNTKLDDVRQWFWTVFDRRQFVQTSRNSVVLMDGGIVANYPIEDHIYMLGRNVGEQIVDEWLQLLQNPKKNPSNFEDFLEQRFGHTLYELYFKPYNQKIWRRDLSQVPLSWLEGKLPMPTVREMLLHNMYHVEERSFVHSTFYYPREKGSQYIVDMLAEGIDVRCSQRVESIVKSECGWLVNGEECDRVVFCGNIRNLPSLLGGIEGYSDAIEKLEYHGTTSVFCEIDKNPYSWLYMPSNQHDSHRIICTGNFSPNNNYSPRLTATIEFTDKLSKEEILDHLKRIPLNPKYLTHHYTACSYPIQDMKTRETISSLKQCFSMQGLYLCGRLAEWEYANMDVCMGSALDLCNNRL
jgi:protoporphyrinogen oxidase